MNDSRTPIDDGSAGAGDVAELIRGANPYPDVESAPPRGYDLEAFIQSVMAGERAKSPDVMRELSDTSRPRRGRKRGASLVAGAIVLGAAGAAAAYVVARDQPSEPSAGVTCYADATAAGDRIVIPPTDDPIAGCAAVWAAGELPDIRDPRPAGQTPPPLVACVAPGRGIDVFPSDDAELCAQLGFTPAGAGLGDESARIVELSDRLVAATFPDCVAPASAEETAQRLIDELGLDGWRVVTRPPTRDGDVCARVGVEAQGRTVYIGAGPPARSRPSSP